MSNNHRNSPLGMVYDAVRVQLGSQNFTQVKTLHLSVDWTYFNEFSLLLQVQDWGRNFSLLATLQPASVQ